MNETYNLHGDVHIHLTEAAPPPVLCDCPTCTSDPIVEVKKEGDYTYNTYVEGVKVGSSITPGGGLVLDVVTATLAALQPRLTHVPGVLSAVIYEAAAEPCRCEDREEWNISVGCKLDNLRSSIYALAKAGLECSHTTPHREALERILAGSWP